MQSATASPGTPLPLPESELRDWIGEHLVCWETVVHRDAHHGRTQVVGYDVVLMARCTGTGPFDPADERSATMFARLSQLAEALRLPSLEERLSIEGFEPAFHLKREHGWAPEVHLVLEIRHRNEDYFSPPDGGEIESLRQVEDRLASWGVRKSDASD